MPQKHPSSDPLFDSLIEKYGTDKTLSGYNITYAEIFSGIKDNIKSVLEIGVGSLISPVASFAGNVGHYSHYTPGGSLRLWRDYFKNAQIYGVDIAEDCLIEEERIKTFIFESSKLYQCRANLFDKKFDIIIDDGDHSALSQLITFKNLGHLVNPGGFYIIEDIGGYSGYEEPDGTWYKPELFIEFLDEFKNTCKKYSFTNLNGYHRPYVLKKQ